MSKNLLLVIRSIRNFLKAKYAPVAYAQSLGVKVGDNVRMFSLHPGAFGSEPYLVELGDGVVLTANVKFITHDGSTFIFRKEYPALDVMGPISVGANTFIGTGTTIMPGVSIGRNCVIGAMSLVTRPIPDNCVAFGSPARVVSSTSALLQTLLKKNAETGAFDSEEKRRQLEAMTPVTDKDGRRWLMSRLDQ